MIAIVLCSICAPQSVNADDGATIFGTTATGAAIGGIAGGGRGAGYGALGGFLAGNMINASRNSRRDREDRSNAKRRRREREDAEDRAYERGLDDARKGGHKRFKNDDEEDAYEQGLADARNEMQMREQQNAQARKRPAMVQEEEAVEPARKKAKHEHGKKTTKTAKKHEPKTKKQSKKAQEKKPAKKSDKPYYPTYESRRVPQYNEDAGVQVEG